MAVGDGRFCGRRPERAREELLGEFRRLRIEPPTPGRFVPALCTAEQSWASRIAGRLSWSIAGLLLDLIAVAAEDDSVNDESASLLALIKASPGNVSLESMMTEISKLRAVRSLDLPVGCSPMSRRGFSITLQHKANLPYTSGTTSRTMRPMTRFYQELSTAQ